LGIVQFLVLGDTAVAQNVQQADLEQCAGLATAEQKLACYENLTAIGSGEAQSAVTSEATSSPVAVVASETTVEGDTSDTENLLTPLATAAVAADPDPDLGRSSLDATSTTPTPSAPVEGPGAVVTGVVAGTSGAKADSAVAATISSGVESASAPPPGSDIKGQDIPEDFGREHLDESGEPGKEASHVTATVIEVEERSNKVLYFYFENGQIWRQLEGRRFSYPRSGEFDVTINTGMMGDYRLRLEKGGPMTRIQRVQ